MLTSFLFGFLVTISQLYGTIIETAYFREIIPHATENTLVILDIDDTLLIPTQMLGCDEWFEYRRKQLQKAEHPNAFEKALSEWEAIRHLTQMEIVEPGTDEIVRSLQEQGITLMALTTQGLALATRTSEQLKAHRFHLTPSAPCQDSHFFLVNGHGVLYKNGILFTSGTSKGESLFTLCEKIGYFPARIVFINDKESHIKDIEVSAERRGVEFIGLRYAYSDSRKKAFDPEIAHYQFTHSTLTRLMSDDEAKSALFAQQDY